MNTVFTTAQDGTTKDTFGRGEMVDFRYNVVSSYKVPVTGQVRVMAWGRQSNDTIFDNTFPMPIDAGNPHWTYVRFYTPTLIPADAKSTSYVVRVSVTVNGQTSSGEHDFYVTAPPPNNTAPPPDNSGGYRLPCLLPDGSQGEINNSTGTCGPVQ